ncbi:restriction endonuclease subunit S [Acinetobacter geminorum]
MIQQNLFNVQDKIDIPAGYKKTEIGIIPKDWSVQKFGELFEQSIPRKKIKINDIVSFVGMQDVSESAQLLNQHLVKVNEVKNGFTFFEKGDVLVAKITPCFENGKGCLTNNLITDVGFGSTEFHVLRANQNSNSQFIYYWTVNSTFRNKLELDMVGSAGHRRVPLSSIRNYLIPLPTSEAEQKKIATVLSDTDALISELEKLIEKKQAIKTATMQQLLTGKTRLPEFALREDGTPKAYKDSELGPIPEDWEVIEFQNLLETTILKRKLDKNSEVTFISMQDVSEKAELKHQQTLAYENIKIGLTYFERNDTLVAKITPCFENGKGCFTDQLDTAVGFGSTEFHVLRSNSNTYPKFIYYWTLTEKFRKSLEKEMVGSAGHRRVPLKEIQKFKIQSSLNKDEQRLISRKISDAESELKVLEAKLEKNRKIKQGMMQELLTGKTRLV